MSVPGLATALLSEVFSGPDGAARLLRRLEEARAAGARLAVLPELPMDRWPGARREPRDSDAEEPGGPRCRAQAGVARAAGVALLGGAILRDPASGRRHNTALLWDAEGRLVTSYRKLHLPEEEGFWETSHYQPGEEPPRPVEALGFRLGVQVCSDVHRPEGCRLLAAGGAEAILAPRGTPVATYDRWRLVLRAGAVTSGAYVVSVNRQGAEDGVAFGGPSLAVAPDGEVLVETEEPLALVSLEHAAVRRARRAYPGYLPDRPEVWARAWGDLAAVGRRAPGEGVATRVLVLCTGNSARSQMAEGLLRELAGGRVDARSAGARPSKLHPLAVRVMAERGIDISAQRSKHLDELAGQSFDAVITVCDQAAESCPVFPGPVRRVHWRFPDPAAATGGEEERLAAFRRVRDGLEVRLRSWLAEELPSHG